MANKLTGLEAEAIVMIQAGNGKAWNILQAYFKRQYEFESTKCIDTPRDKVEVHQGRAKAFRDAMNLTTDAHNLLSSD